MGEMIRTVMMVHARVVRRQSTGSQEPSLGLQHAARLWKETKEERRISDRKRWKRLETLARERSHRVVRGCNEIYPDAIRGNEKQRGFRFTWRAERRRRTA